MKKLTIENIQFIDTYLLSTDIIYEDIRLEMIDHIASDIENRMDTDNKEDFYTVFKVYMIENKKAIEDQGGAINKKITISVSKRFLRNLYSWQVLLGSVLCFSFFHEIFSFFSSNTFLIGLLPSIFMGIVLIIPIIIFGKKRLSFIDNFGLLVSGFFMINVYIAPYIQIASRSYYISLGIMALSFVCSLKTMIGLIKFYKKQLQVIEHS